MPGNTRDDNAVAIMGPSRAFPPAVLHVDMGESARTRRFLARLIPTLARDPYCHPSAIVCPAHQLIERQAGRASVAVTRLVGPARGVASSVRAALLCRNAGRGIGTRVVHAHGPGSLRTAATAARLLRAALIASVYEVPSCAPVKASGARRAARVLVPLDSFRGCVEAFFARPVEVLPWGVDKRDLDGSPVPERVARELGLDPMTLHIGMTGDLSGPSSGGETFVRAAVEALSVIPFCDYVVIGSGDYVGYIEGLAHQLGVLGRFRFVPASHGLARVLTTLSAVVFPGRPRSFPWELVEAAACRTPIVASDCPEHREVLDGEVQVTWLAEGDVAGLAERFLKVLSRPGEAAPSTRRFLARRQRDSNELPLWARPSPTGYDISDGDLDEYDIIADDFSRRRANVLRRFSFEATVARLSELYAELAGDRR